jgi:hypothetical protein
MNHADERTMNGRPPESYLRQTESMALFFVWYQQPYQ